MRKNNVLICVSSSLLDANMLYHFHVPFPASNNANNDADSSSYCISVTSIGSITFPGNQAFNSEAESGGLVSRLLGSRRHRNLK